MGETLLYSCFPPPDPAAATSAEATLTALVRILRGAASCHQFGRYEDGWNHHVHSKVLDIMFEAEPLDADDLFPSDGEPAKPSAQVRCEHVTSATIAGDSTPLFQNANSDEVHLTFSVSAGSVVASDADTDAPSEISLAELRTRTGSKKVDYVLALDLDQ